MSEEPPETDQSPDPAADAAGDTGLAGIAARAVDRIRNEIFLFVVAIVAIIAAIGVSATQLGTGDLRFLVIAICALVVIAILAFILASKRGDNSEHHRDPEETMNGMLASSTQYTVNAPGSIGVAAGPGASVHQEFGQVPHPSDATSPDDEANLVRQLSEHEQNLARLKASMAVYASGTVPADLTEQATKEEALVAALQQKLRSVGGDA